MHNRFRFKLELALLQISYLRKAIHFKFFQNRKTIMRFSINYSFVARSKIETTGGRVNGIPGID